MVFSVLREFRKTSNKKLQQGTIEESVEVYRYLSDGDLRRCGREGHFVQVREQVEDSSLRYVWDFRRGQKRFL